MCVCACMWLWIGHGYAFKGQPEDSEKEGICYWKLGETDAGGEMQKTLDWQREPVREGTQKKQLEETHQSEKTHKYKCWLLGSIEKWPGKKTEELGGGTRDRHVDRLRNFTFVTGFHCEGSHFLSSPKTFIQPFVFWPCFFLLWDHLGHAFQPNKGVRQLCCKKCMPWTLYIFTQDCCVDFQWTPRVPWNHILLFSNISSIKGHNSYLVKCIDQVQEIMTHFDLLKLKVFLISTSYFEGSGVK